MKDGGPHLNHALCFFHGNSYEDHTASDVRWLGILVYSKGERIIFFPGFDDLPTWIETTKLESTQPRTSFQMDHITLEPHRLRWHFTTPGSGCHRPGGRVRQENSGTINWLGLSLSSEGVLRRVMAKTSAAFPTPPTDAERRLKQLVNLQNSAAQHVVSMAPASMAQYQEGFPHFHFAVLPKNSPDFQGPNWLLPSGSPSLSEPFPEICDFPIRAHRINLTNKHDIQITSMWLPGTLNSPVVCSTYRSI
jgi:hypothetical protein